MKNARRGRGDDAGHLHVGLSYVDYDTAADTLRLRARPNADLTPVRLVDTGGMTDTDRRVGCMDRSSCRPDTWPRASIATT